MRGTCSTTRAARWRIGKPRCSAGCRTGPRRGNVRLVAGRRRARRQGAASGAARAPERCPRAMTRPFARPMRCRRSGARKSPHREFRTAERLAATDVQRDGALRAQINTLLELKRKAEARAIFDQAIAHGRAWATIRDADVAYLAVAVGNDEVALARFDAPHNGQLAAARQPSTPATPRCAASKTRRRSPISRKASTPRRTDASISTIRSCSKPAARSRI